MIPEPPANLEHSRELFDQIGATTSMLFYGINFSLFIQLVSACRGTKFNWMHAVTYTMFILASLFQSLLSYVTTMSSVYHLEISGDSSVWLGSHGSRSIQLTILVVGFLNTWLLDSCMLYQCFIVYSIRRRELWVMGLPVLFFLSSIGSGVYLIVVSGGIRVQALPHFPLCISAKLVVTGLIVFKLFQQRRIMQQTIQIEHSKELIRPYTSLIRVLVASYAIYSTFSVLFLGLYLANLSAWRMILPNMVQAGLISHLLVRSQVARNRREEKYNDSLSFSTMDSTSTSSHQNPICVVNSC